MIINRDHCRINYSSLLNGLRDFDKNYLPLLPVDVKDQYEDLLQTQKRLKDDPIFNSCARMIRFLHIRYVKLLEDLETAQNSNKNSKNVIFNNIFANSPLMIPSKQPGKVYVFPNLVLDRVTTIDWRNVCWVVCFDILKTFNATRSKKPNSWQPFSRAWKKIKKYEEMSIIRALIRYTSIEKDLNHEQINNLADSYTELTKPLKLLYAESPKDFLIMLKSGGVRTCMTLSSEKETQWGDILKHGHHPMSLFAYHPGIKGIYCIKDKTVIARTCVYQISQNVWKYGRVFAINGNYSSKFIHMLEEEGYTKLTNRYSKRVTFKVPGIYSKKLNDYVLPMPYMDNVNPNIYGEFNNKNKQFTVIFSCSAEEANISVASTSGFVRASQLHNKKCSTCGVICKEVHVSWDGNISFCSPGCAKTVGYVYALASNGDSQLRIAVDCYYDCFCKTTVFTTKNSCVKNGGLPVIHEVQEKDHKIINVRFSPEAFSTSGLRISYKHSRYCLSLSLYERLLRENLITSTGSLVCSSPTGEAL